MSSDTVTQQSAASQIMARTRSADALPLAVLKALGSLKITVAMFALAMVIVFVGTLAQDEMDLAQVKREFFTCWIASVPIDVLFPTTLFPHEMPILGGFGIYLPGGATIGFILLINLIAAKTTRFAIQGKGIQLVAGVLLSLLGVGLVTVVIMSGHTADGLQGKPPVSYDNLWSLLKVGIVILTVALVVYTVIAKLPKLAKILLVVASTISFALAILLLKGGEDVRLDDPGLRIVWQLLQATIASSVLLAGLWMVFGKRGGNVLIHAGVGLLMVGQFVFGDRQIEQRIGLAEGDSTNLVVIEDEIEIALIDISNAEEDLVYAIPESKIRRFEGRDKIIDDAELPCKVRILDWMQNSSLEAAENKDDNPATSGFGRIAIAKEVKPIGGAIMDQRNVASAYVELIDRDTDEVIETLLLNQQQNDIAQMTASMEQDSYEKVTIDGKPFEVGIRYRQERKPYDVTLKDVERLNYSGTDTARDYSSLIVITDRETGVSQEGKTWMNNPIRYKGETFYQSRYNKVPLGGQLVETTGLQVVKNAGWVVPYVSCMMVFVGMFAHFGVTFANFSNRYARGAIPGARVPSRSKVDESAADAGKSSGLLERLMTYVALYLFPDVPGIELIRLLAIKGDRLLVPALSLAFCLSVGLYFAKPTSYSRSEVDWEAIGALPVQHEGRIKAFDAVARNLLQVISKPLFGSVPYVKDENGKKRTPSEWLLGVMAGRDWVKKAEVFRIYPPEVRDIFDLKPRKGYRYSYAELEPNLEKFRAEIAPLREKESDEFDHREQKLAQMHGQINLWDLVALSYQLPPLPSIPADDASEDERNVFFQSLLDVANLMRQLEKGNPPAMLPPPGEATQENMRGAQWQAYGPAFFARLMEQLGMPIAEQSTAFFALDDLFKAVRNDDVPAINKAVADYREKIAQVPIAESSSSRAAAESWLIKFNPTAQGVLIYLIAIVLGFSGFLFRSDVLRRATFWVLVGVFVIHTVAIVSRIYVSGRAPVINLYSSAVFIGWACVLLGIVLEAIYPIGIANLVSGLIGISTLSVARFLDTQDTLHVLQAVLDTQFWLSTHVITVTAGYAVTFLAGFIGICALVHRMATGYDSYPPGKRPVESEEFQQIMGRMIYGIVCFAIFFSFIGTVLGGLWADDSWGRFWGWDPKENGALMIVLWNALLLHARWDKQVGQRGFAALAVLGNVVTAWSWFGTNQLGIGLHAYGFTSGALYSLIGFISANLVFVLVSLMVTHAFSAGVKNVARGT